MGYIPKTAYRVYGIATMDKRMSSAYFRITNYKQPQRCKCTSLRTRCANCPYMEMSLGGSCEPLRSLSPSAALISIRAMGVFL